MPNLILVLVALLVACIAGFGFLFNTADNVSDFAKREKYIAVGTLFGVAAIFLLGAVVGAGLSWWLA